MRFKLSILLVGAMFNLIAVAPAAPVTLDSLLNEMTDFSAVARWPDPSFTAHQSSSYDRAEVAPDKPGWFANNDFSQYIRTEENTGRREQVMMDADGPGSIVRFWLTTTKNKRGTLRIYLDANPLPVLTFPAYDLLSGNLQLDAPLNQPHPGYSPADNGGNTLRLPIPYARHCKVTWEEAGEGPRYYQIDYRTYAPGTSVQSFTPAALATARPMIAQVEKTLLSPPAAVPVQTSAFGQIIPAGKSAALDLPAGPAAVCRLVVKVDTARTADLERTLRSTIVQLQFDDETTCWCPAGDFFGSGVGVNVLQSWYRTVQPDGTMICRWTMPYAKSARVTIANVGQHPVKIGLSADIGPWSWDDRSLHFHCNWHYEAGLATPPPRDWNYIRIKGRGIYVGDTLALFNPVATWYGEGDEKIRVDEESLPSFLGTGTEDYYDFSFAPRGLMQTPFANQVRVDQPMTQGNNVLTRTRNLDGIPFSNSLNFDFELISWRPTTLIYAATTYWYAFPWASSNIRPQPHEAALPVPTLADAMAASAPRHIPGAIECENLKVLAKSGDFQASEQNMDAFGAERWSGGAQMLVASRAVGDFVEIQIPAPDSGPRKLILYATQAPDYGQLRFSVNGQRAPANFDGYAPDVRPAPALNLGVYTPQAGVFTIRAEVVGANPAAIGAKYLLGLDCVVFENN
jgi:hypothetical protein